MPSRLRRPSYAYLYATLMLLPFAAGCDVTGPGVTSATRGYSMWAHAAPRLVSLTRNPQPTPAVGAAVWLQYAALDDARTDLWDFEARVCQQP